MGIGYLKGGGSIAALFTGIIWYVTLTGKTVNGMGLPLITGIIIIVGIFSGNQLERIWGKDSYKIVIDEVAGMCITLLFIPVNWQYGLTGWILFRFFDIVKPLYIRKMELLPGGWGVMMDDILAGLYANILLSLVIWVMHSL